MRQRRILILLHPRFKPGTKRVSSGTEIDVWRALKRSHSVELVAVQNDLRRFDRSLVRFNPCVVFNLIEEFRNEAVFDFHLVSYLEALSVPVTGCNPRGLIQSRNKFLVGQIAGALGVRCPGTTIVRQADKFKPNMEQSKFPMFVKLNREHASLGIRASNRVMSSTELRSEVRRMGEDYGGEVLVQEYIEGFDVSVAAWGNGRPEVFQPRRISMRGSNQVLTEKIKFSRFLQKKRHVRSLQLTRSLASDLVRQTRILYQALDLSGYVRMDFRVTETGSSYLIDVNANPNLARSEDFVLSAQTKGLNYPQILDRIIRLAMNYSVSK